MKSLILLMTLISISMPCSEIRIGFVYDRAPIDGITYDKYESRITLGSDGEMYKEISSSTFSDLVMKEKFPNSNYKNVEYKYLSILQDYEGMDKKTIKGFVSIYESYIEPVHKKTKKKYFSVITFKDLVRGTNVIDTIGDNINLKEDGRYGVGKFTEYLYLKKYDDPLNNEFSRSLVTGIYFVIEQPVKVISGFCRDSTSTNTITTSNYQSDNINTIKISTVLKNIPQIQGYNAFGAKKRSTITFIK